MSAPCIIEVALSCRPDRNPNAPLHLDDLVQQGLDCMAAGASIVHMHPPRMEGTLEAAVEQYAACFTRWLERDPDVLGLPTVGSGDTFAAQFAHQLVLAEAGLTRLAFVDPGATIFGNPEPDGSPAPGGYVYAHDYGAMRYAIDAARERRLGVHFTCYEPGWLRNVLSFWRAGLVPAGSFVKFYFGGDYGVFARGAGVTFGLPPTLTGLAAYQELMEVDGCDLPWFSAVVGGDLIQTPIATETVRRGGHLRVGLEDHAGDRKPTNVQLVEEAVAMCERLGRPVASPRRAVEALGLPTRVQ
jgi:3-keto-5-aminohexanoate cleavage enzyme